MIKNDLSNFYFDYSEKISIINYTLKRLMIKKSNLEFLIPVINKNGDKEISKSILEKIKELIEFYKIISLTLNDKSINLPNSITDKYPYFQEYLIFFRKENFHYDNFKHLDKFINQNFLKQLDLYTNNKFNNINEIWDIMKNEIYYFEKSLENFLKLSFYAYFPIYNLNPTEEYLKNKIKKIKINLQLWDDIVVKEKWKQIIENMLKFYSMLKCEKKGIIEKSSAILSKYLNKNQDYYADYCNIYSDTEKSLDMNYVEDNQIIKTGIKLALKPVSVNQSFYIPNHNPIITKLLMKKFSNNKYKISKHYIDGLEVSKLKVFGYKEKLNSKKENQKIKLLANFSKYNKYLDDIFTVFPKETDIIIFVSGGGFQTDLEKIAQLYLRE